MKNPPISCNPSPVISRAISSRNPLLWGVCALLLAGAVIAWWQMDAPPTLDNGAGLRPVECWFDPPRNRQVDCFRLQVPETRAVSLAATTASDRILELPVVIVRATAAKATADPVVYLAGGPGSGAWIDPEQIAWWWDFTTANEWLNSRDLVLFDQRGSGLASPRMDCPGSQDVFLETLAVTNTESLRLQREEARRCAEALVGDHYNAAAYTSVDNAEDLHDLFTVLKVPRWNVYGVSYGTRFALEYMRRHPDDIRSVILDSVFPPQVQFFEDDAANTDRAFQYLFTQCCELSYPDLGARFLALVERLNKTPLIIERPHPAKEGRVTIRMDGNGLIYRLFGLLYNVADIETVPRLIDAYERDLRSVIDADLDRYLWEIYGRADFGDAMFLSVQCLEEAPFNDFAKAAAAYAHYPLLRELNADSEASTYHEVCDTWRKAFKVEDLRDSDNAPVTSDIPTLILTGSFDPVTPPAYARLAATTLKNSFLFEFPYLGHDVLGNDHCPNWIAAEFLEKLKVDPVHPCTQLHVPLSFALPSR